MTRDNDFGLKVRAVKDLLYRSGKQYDANTVGLIDMAIDQENEHLLDTVINILEPEAAGRSVTGRLKLKAPIPGRFKIGKDVLSEFDVAIDLADLHGCVFGMNQRGKTTLLHNIARQILECSKAEGVTLTALERKMDLRHLTRLYPNLYTLNMAKLYNNILFDAPTRDFERRKSYTIKTFDLFCQQKGLGQASFNAGTNTLFRLLEEFGKDRLPTIQDFLDRLNARLKKTKAKGEKVNQTALGKVGVMTPTGQALNRIIERLSSFASSFPVDYEQGYPLDEVFASNVAIEYDMVNREDAQLMAMGLFSWLHHRKLWGEDTERRRINHVWIIDEAIHLLHTLNDANQFTGLSAFYSLLPLQKELGDVILAASQSQRLSESLLENTSTLVVMTLTDFRARQIAAARLGLNYNDLNELNEFLHLGKGEVLMRIIDKHPDVIRVQLEDFKVKKTVGEKELEEHNKPFIEKLDSAVSRIVVPSGSDEPENIREQAVTEVKEAASPQGKGRNKDDGRTSISSEAELLLKHINDEPLLNREERSMALRKGSKWMQKHFQELTDAGMIEPVQGNQGGRGGSFILFRLTPAGVNHLRDMGVNARMPPRDLCHRYLLTKLYRHIKSQGIEAEFTPTLNGGLRPDLLLRMGNREIPVELQASGKASDAINHITQLLKVFHLIFVVITSRKLNGEIKRACGASFSASELDKVRFFRYREMMSFDFHRFLSTGAGFV